MAMDGKQKISGVSSGPTSEKHPTKIHITEDAEGVFFLKKHEKGDFYVLVSASTAALPKTQPNYEAQVKLAREVAKFSLLFRSQ